MARHGDSKRSEWASSDRPAKSEPVSRRRHLLEARYASTTLTLYRNAAAQFVAWADNSHENAHTLEELDELVTDYIHYLYDHSGSRQHAVNTVQGIKLYIPRMKHQFVTAERALAGWTKKQSPVPYPPLTWELTTTIAVQMIRNGRRYYRYALATLLSFDCLLRVGETLSLRREDVAEAKDPRVGDALSGMLLRLAKTKTGSSQSVFVSDADVRTLMRDVLATTKPAALLFPFTTGSYRRVFKGVCAQLSLSDQYVPHSLRHGGATRLYLLGTRIDDVLVRGRWASVKSARHYVQMGRAMLLQVKVPPTIAEVGRTLTSDVRQSILLALSQAH